MVMASASVSSTLILRLLDAADALDELCASQGWDTCSIGPAGLRNIITELEDESEAGQLGRAWFGTTGGSGSDWARYRGTYIERARKLTEAGWTKVGVTADV